MKLFVKRENWDGGIWMKLPASEEQAEQVQKKMCIRDRDIAIAVLG